MKVYVVEVVENHINDEEYRCEEDIITIEVFENKFDAIECIEINNNGRKIKNNEYLISKDIIDDNNYVMCTACIKEAEFVPAS